MIQIFQIDRKGRAPEEPLREECRSCSESLSEGDYYLGCLKYV